MIANIARYHRGSQPKKKHDNYRRLAKPDRERVAKLAALLRIAGGLDRSNSRQVQAVSVNVLKDRVVMRALANENPDVDIWAAQRRAEMFEDVFGLPITIEWHDPKQASSNGARRPSPPAKAKRPSAAAPQSKTDADGEKSAKTKKKSAETGDKPTKADKAANTAGTIDTDKTLAGKPTNTAEPLRKSKPAKNDKGAKKEARRAKNE
jgi:hypothetical protein